MQKLRKEERRSRILDELRVSPHVRISVLAEKYDVTTETIRRDLDALSEQGLVDRAFGGASAPMGFQPSAYERGREHIAERSLIGAAAAALVGQGEVLMIDSGSTTVQLARHLATADRRLTVISNCYPVVSELGSGNTRLVVCPGEYVDREAGVFGSDTIDYLRRFHANKAFIGTSGIAADGFSDVNRSAVWVKRTMMERAEEAWLLVDHSKFDVRLLEVVAPLTALTGVVVDREPEGPLRLALARADLRLIVAQQAAVGEQRKSPQFC